MDTPEIPPVIFVVTQASHDVNECPECNRMAGSAARVAQLAELDANSTGIVNHHVAVQRVTVLR